MNFGEEVACQMVTEWQRTFMNYDYLKTLLEDIQVSKKKPMNNIAEGLKRGLRNFNPRTGIGDPVILVNAAQTTGSEEVWYQTKFLMSAAEGREREVLFFRRLDEEFNKVNKFYRSKVEEVTNESAFLDKKFAALIALRIKRETPGERADWTTEMTGLASGVTASGATVATSTPRSSRTAERVQFEITSEEDEFSNLEDGNSGVELKNIKVSRPTTLEFLQHEKIDNTVETLCSTIEGILEVEVDRERELNFEAEQLRKVKEELKHTFIDFYQKLHLLNNDHFLNLMGFSKIMKKYDKVTSRNASKAYLDMVDKSYIGSCDEVTRLIDKVESTFIEHFSNSKDSEGLNIFTPKAAIEWHRIAFSLGFFTGCSVALLVGLILITQVRLVLKEEGYARLFGFIVLHMVMYAANVYFWRRYGVNYPFIFGFKQGMELRHKEVFLLSVGLAALALASVLANLGMAMDKRIKDYKAMIELIPLGLVALVLLITICPFNIICHSSRYFLILVAFRCICAPLFKVTLPDFFLAEQLTSQIQALRSLEFYVCYYGLGDFKHKQKTCKSSDVYNILYIIVAAYPYWIRLLQCLRRLCEERDPMQGYNSLKYFSTVVAVLTRTVYSLQQGRFWWSMALVTSVIATVFSTYWDLIVDWGLLQCNSKNKWLRDKLILPHKTIYFIAMMVNIMLRIVWLQTVLNFEVTFLHKQILLAIIACLEIIRRGIWNFFRLENEHLNNAGKYRAFKSVPLPCDHDEDEDRDE